MHSPLALTHRTHAAAEISMPSKFLHGAQAGESSTATSPGAHFNYGKPIPIFILFLKQPSLSALI